jgi:hypothetical protein
MALPNVSSSNLSVLDDSSFPLFGWLAQTINDSRAISINGDLLWNAYKSDSDKSFIEKIREKSLRCAITAAPRDMLSEMKDSVIMIYRESDAWSVTINSDLSVLISKSLIADVAKVEEKAPEVVRAVSVVAEVAEVAEVAKVEEKAPEVVRAVSVVAEAVEAVKVEEKAPEVVRAVSVVAEAVEAVKVEEKAPEVVRAVSVVAEAVKVEEKAPEVVRAASVVVAEAVKVEEKAPEVVSSVSVVAKAPEVVRASDK